MNTIEHKEINPDDYEILLNRGFIYSLVDNHNKVINDLEAVLKINPNYAKAKQNLEHV